MHPDNASVLTDHMVFSSRNVLLLTPQGDDDFLLRFMPLRTYARSLTVFDFTAFFVRHGRTATENRVHALIAENAVDVVISLPFATSHELSPAFYKALAAKTKLIFWFSDDDSYLHSHSKYFAQTAHAVVTTDPYSTAEYERLGIPAIVYWTVYNKKTIHPVSVAHDIDASFIGDCLKNDRPQLLSFLRENGVAVSLFGKGSPGGIVDRNRFPELISRSKINLNFTRLDKLGWVNKHDPMLNRIRQYKGRPIEVALAGGFCLSEYAPSIPRIFTIGKEIDVFYDRAEMLEKVRYYLAHDDIRREIAARSYERALREYEEERYFSHILDQLAVLLYTPLRQVPDEPVYLSDEFKIAAANADTFASFILIKNGRFIAAAGLFLGLARYGIGNALSGCVGGMYRVWNNIRGKLMKGK